MGLSVIILTLNEEQMITDCLKSVKSLTEDILVVDGGSSDKTVEIAEELGARVFVNKFKDFASQRNFALEKATGPARNASHSDAGGEWIFYVDADERVTPELAKEILNQVQNDEGKYAGFYINRKNFYFGNHEWPKIEKLERFFKKEKLEEWSGKVHESPKVLGEMGELDGFLLHYTHRDFSSMLAKTLKWSKIEAQLRFDAHHPKMAVWRFPRVMLAAFWNSYVTQSGWKVGAVGLIESLYQSFSIFITYARLWEMQNRKHYEKNNH